MDYDDLTPTIEEELTSLKHDIEPKSKKFTELYQSFWMHHKISKCNPPLWDKVKLLLIAFMTVLHSRTRT